MQERSPSGARVELERSSGLRKEHGTPKGRSEAGAELERSPSGAKDSERSTGLRKDARGPETTLFRNRKISRHSWETQCFLMSLSANVAQPEKSHSNQTRVQTDRFRKQNTSHAEEACSLRAGGRAIRVPRDTPLCAPRDARFCAPRDAPFCAPGNAPFCAPGDAPFCAP